SHFTPEVWQGKPAILNIFASWCEPCKAEHELLLELSKRTQVPIYGIAYLDKDNNVANFLLARGNPYSMVAVDTNGIATKPLFIQGIPTTYVINNKGMVVYSYTSMLTEDEIHDQLLPAIAKVAEEP